MCMLRLYVNLHICMWDDPQPSLGTNFQELVTSVAEDWATLVVIWVSLQDRNYGALVRMCYLKASSRVEDEDMSEEVSHTKSA